MLTVLGLDRIHKSMAGYVKSISKRNEGDDKEKNLPIAALGGGMVAHGDDFDAHSEYGRCLTSMFALNHTLRQETGDRRQTNKSQCLVAPKSVSHGCRSLTSLKRMPAGWSLLIGR